MSGGKPRTYENCSSGEVLAQARRLVAPSGRERGFSVFSIRFPLRLNEVDVDELDEEAMRLAVQELLREAGAN